MNLDLAAIGNCAISALVDDRACVVWACWPRFDGDPVFNRLLRGGAGEDDRPGRGVFAVSLEGFVDSEREYLRNSAVLLTRLRGSGGEVLEVVDFMPRFRQFGRMYRPATLIRILRPIAGRPRVRIQLRPSFDYGETVPTRTHGSNHVRYVGGAQTLRLTTNAPVAYVLDETAFQIQEPVALILGPDETFTRPIAETAREFLELTLADWREWVRGLAIPFEWQDAVIRAAITLKLCLFEETGAIVAAFTTSIPEFADSGRNWDYRYCWLRDAHFVVRALNRLGAIDVLEQYLRYLSNLAAAAAGDRLQPVYGIGLETLAPERIAAALPGYRGMGPVRVGNQAFEHDQHDVYGQVILAAVQSFQDARLLRPQGLADFERLQAIGELAYRHYRVPDAGPWEFRSRARVHTYSSLMAWAACDRLARLTMRFHGAGPAARWHERAAEVRAAIESSAWNEAKGAFVDSFGGTDLDASLLLMADVGFLAGGDPRFVSTVGAIERELRRGDHLMRYAAADDFGLPRSAFNICTFWYIDALAAMGRVAEARAVFERMLAARNSVGLLSEDIDPATGEAWGNFPQTYSMVGLITGAVRLSRSWEDEL